MPAEVPGKVDVPTSTVVLKDCSVEGNLDLMERKMFTQTSGVITAELRLG